MMINPTAPNPSKITGPKKYKVIILNNKCIKSACKKPAESRRIYSFLFMIAPTLNLYFSKLLLPLGAKKLITAVIAIINIKILITYIS